MSAIALVGLALLPATFFLSSYLLSQRMQILRVLFNSAGIYCLIVFFAQAIVEIPSMTAALSGLYWLAIAIEALYIILEFLTFFGEVMLSLLGVAKK